MIGETLSHYKILDKLGAGGMGEVYRAEDTTLGRAVAIKVLPEAFTEDPERLARFEREAKLLATLNHPHIAQIYSLEEVNGRKLLVMELVEGQTLAEHISKGPIRLEDSLPIALQIAQALEAAHERGIVHRDLKPANINLTPEGEVKVLDFGLAKPVSDTASGDSTRSPTLTYSPTQAEVLLGTPAYMSPEQARGQEVDKRSDIWAFGVVLWEMLTGERLFDGATVSDVLAAVLRAEPDWQILPDQTPVAIHKLLRRCLTRDPKDRVHAMADARIELDESIRRPELASWITVAEQAEPGYSLRKVILALLGGALAASLGVAAWFWIRPEPSTAVTRRFNLQPPAGVDVSRSGAAATMAISPDGKWVAFRGSFEKPPHRAQLYLRSVEELETHPVPGTEDGWNPFYSPDSRWLGFEANGVLKRVPIGGGEPLVICEAPQLRGASWGKDGTILFAARGEGLFRVSAKGGEPELVAEPSPDPGEEWLLYWPQHLPDGRSALISIHTGVRESEREIAVLSLETGEYRTLFTGGTYPRYVATGHLLYSRLGTLYAVAFDPKRLEVTAEPRPVLSDVYYYYGSGFVAFAVSESGDLVYSPGAQRVTDNELVWVDREGNIEPAVKDRKPFDDVRLSPDGGRLAVTIFSSVDEVDLWIYEIQRENWIRLTDEAYVDDPLWSPDGRWIVFSSEREGALRLFRISSDGAGVPEPLTTPGPEWEYAGSFSPDGKVVAFQRQMAPAQFDIFMLPLEGDDRTPQPFVATPVPEAWPAFSPDGRWVAYESNDLGSREIYVRPYPELVPRIKVSTEGGFTPAWNPNGRELFYTSGGQIWVVPVETEPEFVAGRPEPLVEPGFLASPWENFFQVSPDGQRFLLVKPKEEEQEPLRLVYVPNWHEELEQLMVQKQ